MFRVRRSLIYDSTEVSILDRSFRKWLYSRHHVIDYHYADGFLLFSSC